MGFAVTSVGIKTVKCSCLASLRSSDSMRRMRYNGPAHIMVDEYFATKPGCQKVADELNRRYADMVAKQEKKNGKGAN